VTIPKIQLSGQQATQQKSYTNNSQSNGQRRPTAEQYRKMRQQSGLPVKNK